ncbi:hypothetical protein JIN85_08020 [Luteolibacter pohnpeiensis]|uniref:Uncharacterized protein n=1 Tax=Luteolibacter pohnpeiensis TaxID=454153 RepID=A0A934S4H0_9BACT|nr:hypothetical protein [Luteolibacter pohnpeiensis]MBK1882356.1 hypothetical protein [Luteolibacter pohnpeiensis]
MASTDTDSRMYFNDQFADAADLNGHKNRFNDEFFGGTEFDQFKVGSVNKTKVFMKTIWHLLFSVGLISCNDESTHNFKKTGDDLESSRRSEIVQSLVVDSDMGMRMYGNYYFDSRGGSLSSVYKDNLEVVPVGAVITIVNPYYILGYYEGEGYVESGNGKVRFQKIFFCIDNQGGLEFGLPYDKDPRVMGEAISGRVIFDAYNPSPN